MIPGYATPEGTAAFAEKSDAHADNYRKFAGLTLSNVGLGTYLGDADDRTDALVSDAVVRSVRAGINVIDTAINYRGQKAERSVGKAAAELIDRGIASRDQLFICTKGGYVTNDADVELGFWEYVKQEYTDTGVVSSGDITPSYHCMTPSYLSDQIDRSLRNMGLECIDLVYLHNAAEGQMGNVTREKFLGSLRDAMAMYEERRAEGKIRYYGMATWECFRVDDASPLYLSLADICGMAEEVGGKDHGFRFVQMPFNLYYDQALLNKNQAVGEGGGGGGEGGRRHISALSAASELGIGVFTSVPFMQGRLLQPGTMPDFLDLDPSLRALQFIRSAPGVLAPLMGQKTPEHVQDNTRIMKIKPLAQPEFAELVSKLTS